MNDFTNVTCYKWFQFFDVYKIYSLYYFISLKNERSTVLLYLFTELSESHMLVFLFLKSILMEWKIHEKKPEKSRKGFYWISIKIIYLWVETVFSFIVFFFTDLNEI